MRDLPYDALGSVSFLALTVVLRSKAHRRRLPERELPPRQVFWSTDVRAN
jgi:hypothetical protein